MYRKKDDKALMAPVAFCALKEWNICNKGEIQSNPDDTKVRISKIYNHGRRNNDTSKTASSFSFFEWSFKKYDT